MTRQCRTCHHCDRSHKDMADQGFARCVLRPRWKYQAPTFTCQKWTKKS